MVNSVLFILPTALLSTVIKSRGTFTLQTASSKPDVMYFLTIFLIHYIKLSQIKCSLSGIRVSLDL